VAALAFTTLGSVFLPQLDEGDLLIQSLRIPPRRSSKVRRCRCRSNG
jgi:Cu/Ag efflux pump CusA